jgi:ADP-ribose pyrophosphatase
MKKHKVLKETKISSQSLYKGNTIEIRVDKVRLPDKTRGERFYVVHPGAAVIIGELKKDTFLMIQQFRYPTGLTMLEFPAGKRDHKENTFVTAERELLEETGYISAKFKKLGTIHPCIGYSDEMIDVFFAKNLKYKKQQLDTGEFLNVLTMTKSQIDSAIKSGKLTDAKTISAWMLYKLNVK